MGQTVSAAISRSAPPTEEQLWSYLVQLVSALRAAHGVGLLLRPASLLPSKVLLTSPGRIRVGEHHLKLPPTPALLQVHPPIIM